MSYIGETSLILKHNQQSSMRSRILILQFRTNRASIEHEQQCFVREAGIYTDTDFLDALDTSIDFNVPESIMNGYCGVILGGSGDLDFDGGRKNDDSVRALSFGLLERLRPFFAYLFENDIPTLGICYGHQMVGAFAGALVHFDERQTKSRTHELKIVVSKTDHFIFSDLPNTFYAQYNHKDVLAHIPQGATLLMSGGESCQVSALQYKKNIYTVQFHPELNRRDMIQRIKSSTGYHVEGVILEEIFRDEPDSNRILRNFSKFVAMQEAKKK